MDEFNPGFSVLLLPELPVLVTLGAGDPTCHHDKTMYSHSVSLPTVVPASNSCHVMSHVVLSMLYFYHVQRILAFATIGPVNVECAANGCMHKMVAVHAASLCLQPAAEVQYCRNSGPRILLRHYQGAR